MMFGLDSTSNNHTQMKLVFDCYYVWGIIYEALHILFTWKHGDVECEKTWQKMREGKKKKKTLQWKGYLHPQLPVSQDYQIEKCHHPVRVVIKVEK